MIIGVVGLMCSGKGTFAKYLAEKGFVRLTYSDFLREELTRRGIEINRKNLQDLGDELRMKNGAGYLTEILIARMEKGKNYVLEGIRNPAEISALRQFGKCKIVGIEVPIEKRFQWIIMRHKENDPHSIIEVRINDNRDRGIGEPEYGLQIDKCFKMVDFTIVNDKTLRDFKKKIDQLLKKLKF